MEENNARAIKLLREAQYELEAWCSARPDMAGETPALVKRIAAEIQTQDPDGETENP